MWDDKKETRFDYFDHDVILITMKITRNRETINHIYANKMQL